jgi:hypothetical protein
LACPQGLPESDAANIKRCGAAAGACTHLPFRDFTWTLVTVCTCFWSGAFTVLPLTASRPTFCHRVSTVSGDRPAHCTGGFHRAPRLSFLVAQVTDPSQPASEVRDHRRPAHSDHHTTTTPAHIKRFHVLTLQVQDWWLHMRCRHNGRASRATARRGRSSSTFSPLVIPVQAGPRGRPQREGRY